MKVKELIRFLKEVDEDSEIVSPFIFVGDRTVHGFTPMNGFRCITVANKDNFFVESDNGKKAVCIN